MNLPRYEFCEENRSHLINFIKKAKLCKSNPYCNIPEYNKLSKILPLEHILDKCTEDNEIIDITDSEEEQISEIEANNSLAQALQESIKPFNETIADDVTHAIKEILQTKKCLSKNVISDLHTPNLDLTEIFKQLFDELSIEEITELGISLSSNIISNDNIILAYVKHILIEQLGLEYSDQLQKCLNDLSTKYPEILTEEISNYLLNCTDNYTKVTLQFVDGLSIEIKSKLLRNFILNCKNLEENYLAIFDILLIDQVENDSLHRLLEMLSKSADNYATNKVFGKFLLKLIQFIGKDLYSVEKPMNHIIGSHRSIWKVKIQKAYEEFMHDSMLMSQSLRY